MSGATNDRQPPILPVTASEARQKAARAMRAGGLVAFPTDTIYGVGAAYNSAEGVARIFALKGRSADKAIPILIASIEQLDLVTEQLPGVAAALATYFWPGALTMVLARRAGVLAEIAPGRETIGVRMPAHPLTLELIRETGLPLACSSANRAGEPPALSAQAVALQFPAGLDLILDGGPAAIGTPSTVIDFSLSDRPRVLREGAITRAALATVLGFTPG
jgi:L-threonylcarbamoyladenylate synthase